MSYTSLGAGDFTEKLKEARIFIEQLHAKQNGTTARYQDYADELNLIELFVQTWIVHFLSQGDIDHAIYSVMIGVQAAFLLGYNACEQERAVDNSLPESIRNLDLGSL
jgi:hypothetical protein